MKHSLEIAATFAFFAITAAALLASGASLREPDEAPEAAVKSARSEPTPSVAEPSGTAEVRLLGVNDFHGNLESPGEVDGRPVGGAAHVAAHLDRHESENTIRVHAGDMVGASPLISSHFRDEPTVEAMNLMGFDVGVLGNHEFDKGAKEMMRLIEGGGRAEPSDTSEGSFPGADFPYLAANVVDKSTGESVFPAYRVIERGGARIGFIGVVTPETAEITTPEIEASFDFLDLSSTVNRYADELRGDGVEAIVVLAHSGGSQENGVTSGEVVDEAAEMDGAVDAIFAGHTHTYVNTRVGGKTIVEGGKYGEAMSVVDLKVDRATGEVVDSSANILPTYNDEVRPDPEVRELVEEYKDRVAPIADRVIGTAAREISAGSATEAGESPLGDLIADARRARANADFAFVLTGALRESVVAGELTYGELSASHPGANTLVSVDLTGRQVREILENQYRADGADRILQISGLRFTHDPSRPLGSRVTSVTLEDGTPLDPDETYTVAAGEFMADGGNGFDVFTEGENPREFGTELDALVEYIEELPQPFEAPDPEREERIRFG